MTNNVKNLLPIINKKIPQKLLDTSLRWNIGFWLKDFKHDAIQQILDLIYYFKPVFCIVYLISVTFIQFYNVFEWQIRSQFWGSFPQQGEF